MAGNDEAWQKCIDDIDASAKAQSERDAQASAQRAEQRQADFAEAAKAAAIFDSVWSPFGLRDTPLQVRQVGACGGSKE